MATYYNESDPFAAAWLRELMAEGLIPPGEVDERDIRDVAPIELRPFAHAHFFAGIGGWAYALSLAGWPDDRPVWTGSCPCQPFSSAGRRAGFADERHLWPAWLHLISQCRPPVVMGEQVAGAAGLAWFDLVHDDLDVLGYAVAAADIPAASVGAPHIRKRLFFVADAQQHERRQVSANAGGRGGGGGAQGLGQRSLHGGAVVLADADGDGCALKPQRDLQQVGRREEGERRNDASRRGVVGDAIGARLEIVDRQPGDDGPQQSPAQRAGAATGELVDTDSARRHPAGGGEQGQPQGWRKLSRLGCPWRELEWLPCRDGKARPTQPGLRPLAHGVSNRVGALRGAGNAIVPQVAAEVIRAFMEAA